MQAMPGDTNAGKKVTQMRPASGKARKTGQPSKTSQPRKPGQPSKTSKPRKSEKMFGFYSREGV